MPIFLVHIDYTRKYIVAFSLTIILHNRYMYNYDKNYSDLEIIQLPTGNYRL